MFACIKSLSTELKDKSSCKMYVSHVPKGYLLSIILKTVNKLKSKTQLNQEMYKRKEEFTEIVLRYIV